MVCAMQTTAVDANCDETKKCTRLPAPPFCQHGDADRARFPSFPQQLSAAFGLGQNGNSAPYEAVVQTRRCGGAGNEAREYAV